MCCRILAAAADDLRVDQVRASLALGGFFVAYLPIFLVIGLRYVVRQSAVYERGVLEPEFLAPSPIFGFESQDLF